MRRGPLPAARTMRRGPLPAARTMRRFPLALTATLRRCRGAILGVALLEVALVAPLTAVGGCDDSPTNAARLCQKTADCTGDAPSDTEQELCRAVAQSLILDLLPDPDSYATCFEDLSCADTQDGAAVQGCMDLDPAAYACAGDSLHTCTTQGVCRDIDCNAFCEAQSQTFDSCGLDEAKGHDACWCR